MFKFSSLKLNWETFVVRQTLVFCESNRQAYYDGFCIFSLSGLQNWEFDFTGKVAFENTAAYFLFSTVCAIFQKTVAKYVCSDAIFKL